MLEEQEGGQCDLEASSISETSVREGRGGVQPGDQRLPGKQMMLLAEDAAQQTQSQACGSPGTGDAQRWRLCLLAGEVSLAFLTSGIHQNIMDPHRELEWEVDPEFSTSKDSRN